jgi:site-specific DNA recombinase
VVVYKVDRLSRSLIDFARIIEVFEKHNVSFVSVTQQFNTTNSLGRLTLNILLSFAQFEREIIAERTRDKISAARRKGKWIGGRPVLGYDIDPHGSHLTINADEALQVRAIFKLYLDYNSLALVVPEIRCRGWRTKQWVTRKGATHGGKPFTKGRLFRLLKNPIYIGKINFQKQTYDGEHEAIVDAAIWEKVQQILQRNGRGGGVEVRDSYGALLKGLLRCATCHAPMIRTQSTKDSRRYRQYVCLEAQQGGVNCQTKSVPEEVIKAAVIRQIRKLGSDSRIVARGLAKAEEHRLSTVADLSLERQAAQRELASLENELGTVTRAAMTNLQERIDSTGRRLTEISRELGSLEGYAVDDDGFRAELARFGPVWESLNSREQARIIRTLIERVAYDGKTNRVTVSFRSARIREMCRGAAKKRRD